MTPTEKIDAALDSVLIQSGYTINFFGNPARREAMREAMRKIMTDEYKAGENAALAKDFRRITGYHMPSVEEMKGK